MEYLLVCLCVTNTKSPILRFFVEACRLRSAYAFAWTMGSAMVFCVGKLGNFV